MKVGEEGLATLRQELQQIKAELHELAARMEAARREEMPPEPPPPSAEAGELPQDYWATGAPEPDPEEAAASVPWVAPQRRALDASEFAGSAEVCLPAVTRTRAHGSGCVWGGGLPFGLGFT
jgi:hypothetical protein